MARAAVSSKEALLDAVFEMTGSDLVAQEFTKEEQACISRKISENVKEGRPMDQAVAIAISQCAPEKSRPTKSQAEEPEAKAGDKPKLPGGKFNAQQNADGTWNILDVSIFASHTRELPFSNKKVKFGKNFLVAALKNAVRRFTQDNYMPPLHIHHHGLGENVERAGFFKLKKVRRAKYEGKELWVLFADLVNIPDEIFQKIRAGELPYRSVEIQDIKKAEIDSLALLDHEVPFFRLDLLTIGTETPKGEISQAVKCKNRVPMLAYRSVGTGVNLLSNFGGDVMSKLKYQEETEEEKKKREEMKAQGANFVADEHIAAIKDAIGVIAESLGPIMESLGISEEDVEEAEEKAEETEAPAPVEMSAPKVTASKDGVTADYSAKKNGNAEWNWTVTTEQNSDSGDPVKLAARVDALERERDHEKILAHAMKGLAVYGLSDTRTEKRVREILGKQGPKAVAAYVEAIREHVKPDPPTRWTGEQPDPRIGPEVQDLARFGPETMEKAIRFSKEFEDFSKTGMRFSFDKRQYILDQLETEGIDVSGLRKQEEK